MITRTTSERDSRTEPIREVPLGKLSLRVFAASHLSSQDMEALRKKVQGVITTNIDLICRDIMAHQLDQEGVTRVDVSAA